MDFFDGVPIVSSPGLGQFLRILPIVHETDLLNFGVVGIFLEKACKVFFVI